jgi:DNA-binding winged helix-turn-helix (wHTH) protein
MIYLIDKVLYFRPDDGAIWWSTPNESNTVLTTTASRLLWLLLERQGELLMRDDIIYHVWTRHGLEGSNNSLNQYISTIRRSLGAFGLEGEIIKTVPRLGFMFSREINVTRLPPAPPPSSKEDLQARFMVQEPLQPPAYPAQQVATTLPEPPKKRCAWYQRSCSPYTVVLALLVLLIAGGLVTLLHLTGSSSVYEAKRIGVIGHCELYSLPPHPNEGHPNTITLASQLVASSELPCRESGVFFFQADPGVFEKSTGRFYVASCEKERDTLQSCVSFISNNAEKVLSNLVE